MRCGASLIEVMAVVALIGLAAVAAATSFDPSRVVGGLEVDREARALELALLAARNTAVSTGQPVRVQATRQAGRIGSYQTFWNSTGERIVADCVLSDKVDASWSTTAIVFNPLGQPSSALVCSLESDTAAWQVEVFAVSGQIIRRQVQ